MAIKGIKKPGSDNDGIHDVIYERNINVAVTKLDNNQVRTKASLLDLNHNMRVDLVVDIPSKTIIDTRSQMIKTPFDICAITSNRIHQLKGMKIERGITREMKKHLSGSSGCTHLYELAVEAVRMLSNVIMGFATGDEKEWRERKISDAEFIERAKEFLKDSCLPFASSDNQNT